MLIILSTPVQDCVDWCPWPEGTANLCGAATAPAPGSEDSGSGTGSPRKLVVNYTKVRVDYYCTNGTKSLIKVNVALSNFSRKILKESDLTTGTGNRSHKIKKISYGSKNKKGNNGIAHIMTTDCHFHFEIRNNFYINTDVRTWKPYLKKYSDPHAINQRLAINHLLCMACSSEQLYKKSLGMMIRKIKSYFSNKNEYYIILLFKKGILNTTAHFKCTLSCNFSKTGNFRNHIASQNTEHKCNGKKSNLPLTHSLTRLRM